MAEAISVPENDFLCPVCLEILTDPVTIPCGHSYCTSCIKNCWDQDEEKDVYGCPQCRQTFTPRPNLGRNTILAGMVATLKAQGLQSTQSDAVFAGPGDVECTVCIGKKRKAERSCLECLDSYCATHLCRHEELFPGKHKIVEAAITLQRKMCGDHNKPLEAFCQTDLKCLCVECMVGEHKGHDIVSPAKAKQEQQSSLQWSIRSEISARESEVNKLRENVETLKSSAQASAATCESNLSELFAFFEQKRHEVEEMIRAQEKAELDRAEQLQEEISVLKKRADEMVEMAGKGDDIHFLQNLSLFTPEDLPRMATYAKFSFNKTAVDFYLKRMKTEMEKTYNDHFGFIWRYMKFGFLPWHNMPHWELKKRSCSPEFDGYTAFRHHLLSKDNKKVEWSHKVESYGRSWNRFTDCRQVLCKEALPQCAYWEMEWQSDREYQVSIAFSYHDIGRRGSDCEFGRNDKSWCLERSDKCLKFYHNNTATEVPGPVPSRLGVSLDYQAGTMSFYSINNDRSQKHLDWIEPLFSAQARFTKPLYMGCYVGSFCSVEIKT